MGFLFKSHNIGGIILPYTVDISESGITHSNIRDLFSFTSAYHCIPDVRKNIIICESLNI